MGLFGGGNSSSSTSNYTTTTTTNNVLDAGAVKGSLELSETAIKSNQDVLKDATEKAFNFGQKTSDEAFVTARHAMDALKSGQERAFDSFDDLSKTALVGVQDTTDKAMANLSRQSDSTLNTLSNLQQKNTAFNARLLDGITSLVKSNNTDGASDLIESNQKVYIAIAILLCIAVVFLGGKWGKK